MKTIVFIINSNHSISSLNQRIINACEQQSEFTTNTYFTKHPKHAFEIAKQAANENTNVIVAVGGDGTIHETLNGILSVQSHKSLLAILPNGTGNDFMRTRQHFKNPEQFLHAVLSNKSESIDIGKITSSSAIHYFINIADIGFGGAVIHTLTKQRKVVGGKLAYSLAILKTFFTYKKSVLKISAPDFMHESATFMAIFCNGSIFGSGLTIHPDAKANDGQLNLVIIGNISLLDYLRYLPNLKKGKFIQHPEVHYLEYNEITVESQTPQWTETDGEIATNENINVTLVPNCIEILTP
jgi:YegS/Rv2252/BmrU family lipid kinase